MERALIGRWACWRTICQCIVERPLWELGKSPHFDIMRYNFLPYKTFGRLGGCSPSQLKSWSRKRMCRVGNHYMVALNFSTSYLTNYSSPRYNFCVSLLNCHMRWFHFICNLISVIVSSLRQMPVSLSLQWTTIKNVAGTYSVFYLDKNMHFFTWSQSFEMKIHAACCSE
jgi:hypothetical protein